MKSVLRIPWTFRLVRNSRAAREQTRRSAARDLRTSVIVIKLRYSLGQPARAQVLPVALNPGIGGGRL
jgi:hypothetical protein